MGEQNKIPNRKQLKSGERQVRKTLDKVGKWHKWRYSQVLPYIKEGDVVLDIGCGVGYGSYILSKKAGKIIGIDDSQEAIDYANKYWLNENIEYKCQDVFGIKGQYDIIVALELIEHIKDTEKLFQKFNQWTKKYLFLTVPHISINLKTASKYHWRHFSEEDIKKYIKSINFSIEKLKLVKFGHGLAIFCIAKRNK